MVFGGLSRLFSPAPEIFDLEQRSAAGCAAIEVNGLRKTFKRREKRGKKKEQQLITAVDGISFSVGRGEIFGLLGPNSSGKTTTLRCLATLTKPDAGSVHFYGVDVLKRPIMAKEMLGFVSQNAGLDKVLTGREHLDLFANLFHLNKHERKKAIESAIELLDLEAFIDRQTGVYSGGIARRLDIAISLLHRPPIIVMDEPTVGLDIESRTVIWNLLKNLRAGGTSILLTSHYLEEMDVLSDRVAVMEQGVIIAEGTPTNLKDALGGDRISVRLHEFTTLADAQRAADEIRKRGLARDAVVNQLRMNQIEFVVDSDRSTAGSEIISALSDIGFDKVFSFSQSKPSLDDVYLAATGRSIADADLVAKEKRDVKMMRKEAMK